VTGAADAGPQLPDLRKSVTVPAAPGQAYRELHRHGEFGQQVWHAVAGASPGESLTRYAAAVARHRD